MVKNLQFVALGGADEVGQSCFLLGDGEKWIMLDCGLSPKNWQPPNFEFLNKIKDQLAAVLISHAHSDHVGGLPFLFAWMKKNGWICLPAVVSTPVTKAISEVLLRNVFQITKVKAQETNYSLQDLEDLLSEKTWETLYYDEPQERRVKEVAERVLAHFIDANHIPGSASIVINWDGFPILYTGDCCHSKTRFPGELTSWKPYEPAIVISESTYGQEVQLDPNDNDVLGAEDKLIKDVRETLKGEGRVLIPVFAVGRAEEIMLTIADALKKGRFPHVKCYSIGLQNRLVNAVLEVATKGFEANSQKMQEYANKLVLIRDTFSQVLFARGEAQVDKEKEVNQEFLALRSDTHPMIIIATDGHLGGTSASANLASKMLDEPNSRIIVVAYQDEDSPAYRLLDNVDELKETAQLLGRNEKQLEQAVLQIHVRSHILPKALVEILKQVSPETVMLVHGTNESKIHLGNLLTQNSIPVWYTKPLQTAHIDCETGKVGTEPFDKPVEKISLPLEAGRDAFIEVKKWLSEASGVAAVRVSEISAPVFDLGENLRGTPWPGYYRGQQIWVNPELPPEALKPLLIHTITHYVMDLLNVSPKREELTFQERVFVEGAAEYVAFQLTGKALTDCVNVGDDGKEHPADYSPYSEGFRKFSLIEKTYGKSKVAELITVGTVEAFDKSFSDAMVIGVPPQEGTPPQLQPLPKAVAPPEKFKEPFLKQIGHLKVGKNQKIMLIAGVAVIILVLFFLSDLFLPQAFEPQIFSTENLSNPLSLGEYSFRIIANVQEAPLLVESRFVLNSSYSFSETDQIELTLEGTKLPRGGLQISFEDYDKDNNTDWVARGNWEFFETGNVTIPAKLKVSGGFTTANFLVYSKILPKPTVEITFALVGINAQEFGYSQVLQVDDTSFLVSDLPKVFSWEFGSVHTYNWTSPVTEEYTSCFLLQNISGLSSENNVIFNVPSVSGNIAAQYSKQFLVTTAVYGDGSVNLPVESWQNENTSLNLTATPTSTGIFKYWMINDNRSTENPVQIMVNQSFRIECFFNKLYNVEFDCNFKSTTSTPVLRVGDVEYFPTELPKTFIAEESTYIDFEWYSPVVLSTNDTRMAWTSITGACSQSGLLCVMENGLVFANYTQEYLIRIGATEGGYLSPEAGTYWYQKGEVITLTAYSSGEYTFNYWLVNGVNSGNETSLSVTATKPLNITAVFQIIRCAVTFNLGGIGETSRELTMVIDGANYTLRDFPKTFLWDAGSVHSYLFMESIASRTDGKRFRLDFVDGAYSPLTVSENATITGSYLVQWRTLFTQTGLDSSAYGTVLVVEGFNIDVASLPYAVWKDEGSYLSYDYSILVASSNVEKRFNLTGVAGAVQPILVETASSVTGTYATQWSVTFFAVGLDETAYGTTITVNSVPVTNVELPYMVWVTYKATVTYSFNSVVTSYDSGKRFSLTGTSGPASPAKITAAVNITGTYATQFSLTITSSPSSGGQTSPATGETWYLQGSEVQITATANVNYTFSYFEVDSVTNSSNPIKVVMNQMHQVVAVFSPQIKISTKQLQGVSLLSLLIPNFASLVRWRKGKKRI